MAAGAPARHPETFGVCDAHRDETVDAGEHVKMAVLEVPAYRLAIERVAVARAAAVIRPQHGVAARRPHRLIVKKDRAPPESIRRLRTAMKLDHQRIARTRCVGDWIGEHAFDGRAIAALPPDAFLPRQREVAIEIVVDPRHTPRGRVAWCPRIDIADARRLVDHEHVAASNGTPGRRYQRVVPASDLPRLR